jgi:putative transposase
MTAAEGLAETTGVVVACSALAVARATYYRRHRQRPAAPRTPSPRRRNHRRICDEERARILQVLNSERFMDKSPEQVAAILFEEDQYLASPRTMYRVLAEVEQVRERRDRRRHPVHHVPRLVARGPNEIWSWDITKLKGPCKGIHYLLYVILDIFSRYVVGWLLAERENARLAQHLLRETMAKHGIEPGQLTVHQDRGSPMRAKTTKQLLDDLGASRSYSRPRVSNDNPFSESQFGTLKQRPELPDRLGSPQHGRQVMRELFAWYNHEHHHSGIVMLTPAQLHYGLAEQVLAQRHAARLAAYEKHPERFINGPPRLEKLPAEVWINKPADDPSDEAMPSIANISQGTDPGPGVKAREATAKPLGLDAGARVSHASMEVVLRH